MYQLGGLVFESIRLIMVQKLLSAKSDDPNAYKMDPLVSLYYYAPVCAVMNMLVALVVEVPTFEFAKLANIGPWILIANASVAFLLNVASVFLVRSVSSRIFNSITNRTNSYRLAKLPLSSLHFVVSSRMLES